VHPRVSLHEVCFLDEDVAEFAAHCRAIGVGQTVLVSPRLLAPGGIEAASRALRGGPRVAALYHMFATFPDLEGDAAAAAEQLGAVIDMAGKLGAPSVYLLTGGRGSLSWEQAARRFTAAIAPCLAAARERGIALLIENSAPLYADVHLAHTLADTLELAELSGTGICIDLFACWAEAGLARAFARGVPRCGLVQVSDYVLGDRSLPARAVPGDGAIPLERLLGLLLEAGYPGVFDLELVGPRIEAEGGRAASRRAAERLSEILTRLGA
jgi:sugar phosphate isomerase/epimerase